ncbi:Leishmanolysin-like peptidase [Schistosoma japonicum]|nr:Leishmanolysin-like peptidase [Schistosoma japonicum]
MGGQQTSTWCDEVFSRKSDLRCIPHTNGYGYCNLRNHSYYLKPEHTHFNNLANIPISEQQMMGGVDSYADHCPYMSIISRLNPTSMNSHCEDTDNRKFQHMTYGQQHYGKKSRCFNFVRVFLQTRTYISSAGCFRFRCTLQYELRVLFKGIWCICPSRGGTLSIYASHFIEDRLECPSFHDVCSVKEIKERILKRKNKILEDANTIKTNRIL